MPVSATPSIVRGPAGSPVLVDGSPCVPATVRGVAVGAEAAIGAAVGAVVGAMLEAPVAIGVAVGAAVAVTEGAGVNVVTGEGTGVAVAPGATVNGGRVGGIGGGALHVDVMILLVSSVTAALLAKTRPSTNVPVVTVIDVKARMVPRKVEPVPSVAELPTCQKTLHALAPLMRITELADAVMSVEGDWKIQTEFELPSPSNVRAPVRSVVRLDKRYTPPTRGGPPPRAPRVEMKGRPAAFVYAVPRSFLA
jgi:hypothetical protein